MAKKNKGNEHNVENILENLHNLMSQMSDEQKDMLMALAFGFNPNKRLNAQYYRYEAPEYHAKPIAKWLEPLLHIFGYWEVHDACDEAMALSEDLSLEEKRNDIKNLFYAFFEEFEPTDEIEMEEEEDDEERYGNMSLIAAMQLMEFLGLDDCEDVVLESLRQDAYFWAYYTEGGEEYITYCLFRMCNDQPDLLLDFLMEGGLIPSVKPIVFDTLVMIYLHCPMNKLKVSAVLSSYLSHCHSICMQGADASNIDAYAYSLASAHARETLPILKKIYRDIDVPQIEMSGYDDIKETMDSDDVEFRYKHTTIKELILETENEDDEDDYYFDEEDIDDENEDGDDNMPPGLSRLYAPYNEPKKYTLRIAMLDALEPVERTFTVPSTMYLNHLANIIMIALGHDGMAEDYYYFVDRDEVIYSSIGTNLEDYETTEMTEGNVVADLLVKKNSSILLAIVGDDDTEWQISVLLESPNGKYKEDSTLGVKLTSGYGSYPPATCRKYKMYEQLFAQHKLKEPNLKAAQKKIDDYLESIDLPF